MLPLPDSLGTAQNSKRKYSAQSLCSTVIYDCALHKTGASLGRVPQVLRNPQNFEIYLMEPALRQTLY